MYYWARLANLKGNYSILPCWSTSQNLFKTFVVGLYNDYCIMNGYKLETGQCETKSECERILYHTGYPIIPRGSRKFEEDKLILVHDHSKELYAVVRIESLRIALTTMSSNNDIKHNLDVLLQSYSYIKNNSIRSLLSDLILLLVDTVYHHGDAIDKVSVAIRLRIRRAYRIE